MTLEELAQAFVAFTNEHYAKKDLQEFFSLFHRTSLRGMGVGTGADVATSGEIMAMSFIRDALQRNYPGEELILFDVGANTGGFAKLVIQAFDGVDRRIYCFEPSGEAFAALEASLAGSGARLFNIGLGDREERIPLFADRAGSGLASVYPRRLDHMNIPMTRMEDISLTTVDAFTAVQAIDRIHFLKLDVEGHELKCIEGARAMIDAGRVDFIQFEFGGTNIDSRTYFQDFWYALPNYRLKRILRDGFYDIVRYDEYTELFVGQNYLAERIS